MKLKAHLNQKELQKLADDVQAYADSLNGKCKTFIERITNEIGIPVIDNYMNRGGYVYMAEGYIEGSNPTHSTRLELIRDDSDYVKCRLVVEGEDLLFIEFGAGVYFNGNAGSSPHPKGEEFGYTIGGYGQGKGKRKAWGYYDDVGDLIITHGTQMQAPVYTSALEMRNQIMMIAREVFANG